MSNFIYYLTKISEGMAGQVDRREIEIAERLRDIELPESDNPIGDWTDRFFDALTQWGKHTGTPMPDFDALRAEGVQGGVFFGFPHYFLLRSTDLPRRTGSGRSARRPPCSRCGRSHPTLRARNRRRCRPLHRCRWTTYVGRGSHCRTTRTWPNSSGACMPPASSSCGWPATSKAPSATSGFLHRKSIGARSITDRNTYDIYGPHERITFAHKAITTMRDRQDDEWDLIASMSLVHFVFPNVSISGLPGRGFMLSRILPGSTPRHSTVEAFQYFYEPMVSPEQIEAKRNLYYQVTTEEDYSTVRSITDALPSMAGDVFRYGRNEPGNQNAHRWIDALIAAGT